MSFPSLAPYIAKRPFLLKLFTPLSNWYMNAAGYRQMGLRADDLIPEEDEHVQAALRRLSPKESYDRVYRIRRAAQLSLSHKLLPKNEWTKPEEDTAYLGPLIAQIKAEAKERHDLDSVEVIKNH